MDEIVKSVNPHAEMGFRGLGDTVPSFPCRQIHLFIVRSWVSRGATTFASVSCMDLDIGVKLN